MHTKIVNILFLNHFTDKIYQRKLSKVNISTIQTEKLNKLAITLTSTYFVSRSLLIKI